jgi:hypothetical protein
MIRKYRDLPPVSAQKLALNEGRETKWKKKVEKTIDIKGKCDEDRKRGKQDEKLENVIAKRKRKDVGRRTQRRRTRRERKGRKIISERITDLNRP